ncbi:ABC transporter substrate-binding protein [Specibacter sp. RAF43]|uniref:ABC transporter substrate-binding protein n=1 Tax=Specibacter sp. RAF43 TaxID=3233057 RepID=UPI003F9C86D0
MNNLLRKTVGVSAIFLVLGGLVSGCSAPAEPGTSVPGATAKKIGLLLPEVTTLRYEEKDKPYFTEALTSLCPDCTLLYANASSDASKQLQQAQSMLTQGVNVLVVDPYDGVAAASIVQAAKAQKVPVISYDRLIKSPDVAFSISNDYTKVGELQGAALVDKLKADGVATDKGGILMINGAETDPNAANIKKGAHSAIDASGYKVLAEYATWDPAEAQNWVASQLTKFTGQIVGVYSANDGNGGSAIAAMKAAGVHPLVPVTGLDASLAGLQRIVAGDQYMTIYNPFREEAKHAAMAAVDLANGKTPESTTTVDGIPTFLNLPIAVNVSNITDTVIKDDFYKASEICTANFAAACAKANIK